MAVVTWSDELSVPMMLDSVSVTTTIVNSEIIGLQKAVTLTVLADGRIVFVWISEGVPDGSDILFRFYSPDGHPLGDPVRVETGLFKAEWTAAIRANADGGFTLGWASSDYHMNGFELYTQDFDQDGVAQAAPTEITSSEWLGIGFDSYLSAETSVLASGNDVYFVYDSLAQTYVYEVRDPDGNIVTPGFLPDIAGAERFSLAIALSDGTFVVFYSYQDDPIRRAAILHEDGSIKNYDLPVNFEPEAPDGRLRVSISENDTLISISDSDILDFKLISGSVSGVLEKPVSDLDIIARVLGLDGLTPDVILGAAGDDATFGDGNDNVHGGDGDDILRGAGGTDRLYGEAGNDTLDGGDDADDVLGGAGDDLLDGGAGDDLLIGGAGSDTISGGLGDDTILGGPMTAVTADHDVIDGGDGNDFIRAGRNATDILGGSGNDTISLRAGSVDAGDGDDEIYVTLEQEATVTGVSVDGGTGTDTLHLSGINVDLVAGTLFARDDPDGTALGSVAGIETFRFYYADAPDANVFRGDDDANHVFYEQGLTATGGGGDDVFISGEPYYLSYYANQTTWGLGTASAAISGGDGNDYIEGGNGDDLLSGDDGDDQLFGGMGQDVLHGGLGHDSLSGGSEDDLLYGEDGDDTLAGDDGHDVLDGGIGNDSLIGGAEGDFLYGDDGDDSLQGDSGDDFLDGGVGSDTAVFAHARDEAIITAFDGGLVVAFDDGVDTLFNIEFLAFSDATIALADIVFDAGAVDAPRPVLLGAPGLSRLDGTPLDDEIVAAAHLDYVFGYEGNDVIYGADTNYQMIDGGSGDDYLQVGDGGWALLLGGDGNDTLVGSINRDKLDGGDGDDTLLGGDGDDILNGGDGNDVLDGGAGRDTLLGGFGDDVFYCDDDDLAYATREYWMSSLGPRPALDTIGTDTIYFRGTDGASIFATNLHFIGSGDFVGTGNVLDNVITGGDGNDTLNGRAGADTMVGYAGDDTYSVDDPDDVVVEQADEGTDTLYVELGFFADGPAVFDFADQAALISNIEIIEFGYQAIQESMNWLPGGWQTFDATITGDEAANRITLVNNGTNVVDGAGGDDEIRFRTGTNTAWGGDGDDTIISTGGPDDHNWFSGGDGNDTLQGGSGNDTIAGDAGDDVIDGGHGNDTIAGDAGDDVIDGGLGDDTIDGGEGNDTITDLDGTNFLRGGDGDDVISGDGQQITIFGDDGNDTLTAEGGWEGAIHGGTGDDLITSSIVYGTLYGEDGNDRLVARGGSSIIYGGGGNDTIDVIGGSTKIFGGVGNDVIMISNTFATVDGGAGFDVLQYNVDLSLYVDLGQIWQSPRIGIPRLKLEHVEGVIGGTANDTLIGTVWRNVFLGREGNDRLFGKGGADTLNGGLGNDVLNGGLGVDTAVYSTGADITVDLRIQGRLQATGEGLDNLVAIENVRTGTGNDVLIGNIAGNRLQSGGGDNRLLGLGGNDQLIGNLGADVLNGGAGVDTAWFSTGADITVDLRIAGPQDTGEGLDTLVGIESVNTGTGNDVVIGNNAGNRLQAGGGDDTLFGLGGNDQLFGADGADSLNGGFGRDYLFGGANDDTLSGGVGFDLLIGGTGNDRLTGGIGTDTFFFSSGSGADVITDFTATGDFHDLLNLKNLASVKDWSDLKNNHLFQVGDDVVIYGLNGDNITLLGVHIADLTEANFVF